MLVGNRAHVASLRFLKFSVKVVRHKNRGFFCGRLWKKYIRRCTCRSPGVVPCRGCIGIYFDIPKLTHWGEALLFGPRSIHVAPTDVEYIAATGGCDS